MTSPTLLSAPTFKCLDDFAHYLVCLLQVVDMDMVVVTANIFFEFVYLLRQCMIFAKQVLEYLRKSWRFLRIVVPGYEVLLNNFCDRYINAILDIRQVEIKLRVIVRLGLSFF